MICASASGRAVGATKVACVGDSITFGAGTTAGNDYPSALSRLLGAAWQVKNFGNSGRTMMKDNAESYWLTQTFKDSKAFAPDVVVIMLGTNDSKTAYWNGGNNKYEADYKAMIAEYAALPSHPQIVLGLPPPAIADNFTINGKVIAQEVVPIVRKVASATGSRIADVHGAFSPDPKKYFGKGDGIDIGDGVHPNDAGAKLIAQTVAKVLTTSDADGGVLPSDAAPSPDARAGDGKISREAGNETNPGASDAAPSTDGAAMPPEADASPADTRRPIDASATPDASDVVVAPREPQDGGGCHCGFGGRPTDLRVGSVIAFVALALVARRRRHGRK